MTTESRRPSFRNRLARDARRTAPLLLAALLLGPGLAHADRFVATTGSDAANDCTSAATPCASIAAAVGLATAGEVVHVGSGSFAGTISIAQPITLRGAQAGVPVASRTAGSAAETIVDARGLPSAINVSSGGVVIEGLDLLGNAQTYAGIVLYANADLPGITIRDNFIHGMALANPNASFTQFAYGVFGITGVTGDRKQISGLTVQGNEISNLGVAGSVAGAAVYVHNVAGLTPGAGATIAGNLFRDLASRDAVLNVGAGIVIDAGADDFLGLPTGPSSGVAVAGNTYVNADVGAALLAAFSSFTEPASSFFDVGALVVNLGRFATIDLVTLERYVESNALIGFPDSDGYFGKIQSAIDASVPGTTISATAHVFPETVTLSRGIQMLGARAGEDARTRDPLLGETEITLGVLVRAQGGVLDGVSVTNPGGIAVHADMTTTTATVRNVAVTTATRGIALHKAQSAVVQQNLLQDIEEIAIEGGSDNNTPVLSDDVVTLAVIQDNEIVDAAVGIGGYLRLSTISRNVVRDHPGFELGAGIAGQLIDSVVEKNTVSGYERGAGVLLAGFANRPPTRDTVFKCNVFSTNYFGVLLQESQGPLEGILLRSNTVDGNTLGMLSYPEATLDATLNWWGCAGGPGVLGCDVAGVSVDYDPFLVEAPDCASCTTNDDCQDNVLCNGEELCDPDTSLCAPGTPLVCDTGAADPSCNVAACEELFGCVVTPLDDGTRCDTDPSCSSTDTCVTGVCVAGPGAGDEDGDGVCDANDGCAFCGLPMEVEKARVVRNSGNARDNGKVVVKGSFIALPDTPEAFDVSGPISVGVRDAGNLVVDVAFAPGECKERRSIVTCKSTDRRFVMRVKPFRPREGTGKQIMNFTLRKLDIGPTFQAPVTVSLRHGTGVVRTGSIADCKTAPGLLRCF